jgi:hypothetical protein
MNLLRGSSSRPSFHGPPPGDAPLEAGAIPNPRGTLRSAPGVGTDQTDGGLMTVRWCRLG